MIELRPVSEGDRWALHQWRSLPDVARYMYDTKPISRDVHDAWFTQLLAGGGRQGWVIRMDDVGVGAAFMSSIDLENRNASWAFYLADSSTRGRGVGSAVEYLVLEHAFSSLRLHKLCCEVMSFNGPVIAMHKKFGFVEEGRFREHKFRDGSWVDVHSLAMFDDAWSERREGFASKLRGRGLIG